MGEHGNKQFGGKSWKSCQSPEIQRADLVKYYQNLEQRCSTITRFIYKHVMLNSISPRMRLPFILMLRWFNVNIKAREEKFYFADEAGVEGTQDEEVDQMSNSPSPAFFISLRQRDHFSFTSKIRLHMIKKKEERRKSFFCLEWKSFDWDEIDREGLLHTGASRRWDAIRSNFQFAEWHLLRMGLAFVPSFSFNFNTKVA